MKRRRWLWISGGALAVLVLLAAALFAPRPREKVERDLEQFAAKHGLREIDPSEYYADNETDDGLKITWSPSDDASQRVQPSQFFESNLLSVEELDKLSSQLDRVLGRAGSNGGPGRSSKTRINGRLTSARMSRTLLYDWGTLEVDLVFSLHDKGRTTTSLAVWKSRRSLWDRIRDRLPAIAP